MNARTASRAPLVSPLRFLASTLARAPRRTLVLLALSGLLVLFGAAAMMLALEASRATLQALRVDAQAGGLDERAQWLLAFTGSAAGHPSVALGLLTVTLAVLAFGVAFWRDCLFDRVALATLLDLRQTTLARVLRQGYAHLLASDSGSISKRVFQDMALLQRLLVDCVLLRLVDAVQLASCLAYLLWLQPGVALLAGAVVLAHAALAVASARLVQSRMRTADDAQERLWSRVAQVLGRLRLARASGAEDRELQGLAGHLQAETRARRAMGAYLFADKAVTGLLHFIGPVLILVALVFTGHGAAVQPETFAVLVVVLGVMFTAADNLTAVFMDLARIRVATDNIQDLLSVPLEQPGQMVARPAAGASPPLLQVRELKFRYPGQAAGLYIDNLAIHRGERVALLGASGLGKSTLLELLFGLHDAFEGQIELGPWQLHGGCSGPQWRQALGWLPASVDMVEGDLHDNLFYGQDVPRDAASECRARAVLRRFGLDAQALASTAMGPAGSGDPLQRKQSLSTGQIRRIQLARTLLRDFRLALLDEPVAPLAPADRTRVMQLFFEAMGPEAGALVVTHQTDILPLFDRVVILGQLDSGDIGIVNAWCHEQIAEAIAQMGCLDFLHDPQSA